MFAEVISSLIVLVIGLAVWALIFSIFGPFGAALLLVYYAGK